MKKHERKSHPMLIVGVVVLSVILIGTSLLYHFAASIDAPVESTSHVEQDTDIPASPSDIVPEDNSLLEIPPVEIEEEIPDFTLGYDFGPIHEDELLKAFYIENTIENPDFDLGETNWRRDQVQFTYDGTMILSLAPNDNPDNPGWLGAQVATMFETGHGYYEVEMKPYTKGPGVVTAFFLYNHANLDEIDIEFNSLNPHRIELNYFAKGVSSGIRNGLVTIDLGFDAFADYHKYGIYYGPDMIVWYVDGEEVHRSYYEGTPEIVDSNCVAMVNLWAGGNKFPGWLGATTEPEDGSNMSAYVKSIKFTPIDQMATIP